MVKVGDVVSAGLQQGKWLNVTGFTDRGGVIGHTWSAKSQRWTKGTISYHKDAINRTEPRCPKPEAPELGR